MQNTLAATNRLCQDRTTPPIVLEDCSGDALIGALHPDHDSGRVIGARKGRWELAMADPARVDVSQCRYLTEAMEVWTS